MNVKHKFKVGQKVWYTDYETNSRWETNLYYGEIKAVDWNDDYEIYMYNFTLKPGEWITERFVSDSPKEVASAVDKTVKEEIRLRRNMLSEFKKNVMKAINEQLKEQEEKQ